MRPTDILRHEHQVVLLVLEGAERIARDIDAGKAIPIADLEQMLDFFRNFVDRCHHGKEEELLFPKMQERGLPGNAGPLPVMRHEHEEGRQFARNIASAVATAKMGEPEAQRTLPEYLRGYAELLRAHIAKEDNVLFPMADRILEDSDQAELSEAFDKVESEEMGEGVHEQYHQLAHRLAKR